MKKTIVAYITAWVIPVVALVCHLAGVADVVKLAVADPVTDYILSCFVVLWTLGVAYVALKFPKSSRVARWLCRSGSIDKKEVWRRAEFMRLMIILFTEVVIAVAYVVCVGDMSLYLLAIVGLTLFFCVPQRKD